MAHSNKTHITVDNIDWTSEADIKTAFSHIKNLRAGYKQKLDSALTECQQCLDNYAKIVSHDSVIYMQAALDHYKSLKTPHDQCLYDILHLHKIMENNKMLDMKLEENINDRKLLKNNVDTQAKDTTTHIMQGAILQLKTALAEQKMAETANRTGFADDFEEEKPLGARRRTYQGFKDQPTFHPKHDITPNSTSVQFTNWLSDLQSAYDTSNCKTLSTRDQQKFVQKFMSQNFIDLIKDRMCNETEIFPPTDPTLRTGASMIEMMMEINQAINPKLIDKSKFFDRVQGEKESNHKYLAEMKHLYIHHEIAKMPHEDILSYMMIKGFYSPETKKEIVKSVEGKSDTISVKDIESTINTIAQGKRFSNFGSHSNNSVNKINFQRQNQQQNQQSNQQNQQQPRQNSSNNQQNDSGFVDFGTLKGWKKINAMKRKGYCTRCVRKHDPDSCSVKDNYKCKFCLRNHLPKACAGFKKLDKPKQE